MTRSSVRRIHIGPSASRTLAATIALVLATAVHAQTAQPAQDKAQALRRIVVHAKVLETEGIHVRGLSQRAIFKSALGDKVMDRQQIAAAGPVGGSAQALAYAPGVAVSSYGATGSTKYQISINGIKQGWGGFSGGEVDNGSIAVSFDGVPMVNPATGLWESPEVPQTGLLAGIRVTYGPGDPVDRWYNNIGGAIAFVPLQPSAQPGGELALSYGSFNTQNVAFNLQTGSVGGWETVIAGGAGSANSFRRSPDGYAWPSKNFAAFIKTRKTFSNGDISFGGYIGDGHGWRPTPIPLTPVPDISVNGQDANGNPNPGPLLSQQTTGYYSALNQNVWAKDDYNRTWMLYARQNLRLDEHTTLHNLVWYRQGNRLHKHFNNYVTGASNLYEYNNPYSKTYGDKLWTELTLPYNDIALGGYFLNSKYNSRNAFYSPLAPYFGSYLVPNAKFRSDYWYVTDLAAFIQDTITPVTGFSITPGLRAVSFQTDYYPRGNVDFAQAYALYPGNDQGKLPAASTRYDKLEPSLSARWQPLRWLALYGNWGVAYRLPPVGGGGGLYQSQPVGGNILERGLEWQAGVKMHWYQAGAFRDVLLNANYYHLHFSNQFIGVSSGNGQFLGLGTGDSNYHGVNLSAEGALGVAHLFGNANFEQAYFNHYAFNGTNYDGLPVSYVPDTTFNVGAYYRAPMGGGIVLKPRAWYQYTGSQHVFDNNLGAPSQQTMPAYGTLNLAVGAELPRELAGGLAHSIELNLEVLNALGKRYNAFEEISSGGLYNTPTAGYVLALPGTPRVIYGTLDVKF
ncbi:TonB-dependent receptor [Metallibacterium sp.]|uniref:TonB-dependent receptor n=1 Tax=Metallibacterium sp. TaxID=2940281 RepID=UPI00261E92DB|nr:TonB-dependent receptor [Metallibacterium sp.]